MIPSLIDNLGPWSWIVLGLALMGLELLAPGAFLLWLGFAAVLTGMLDWWLGLSWQAALLVFAVLSVASVLAGRAMTRDRDAEDGTRPPLNRRAQSLVGSVFTLDAPIAGGSGRVASTIRRGASSGRTRRLAPACASCASKAQRWWWRRPEPSAPLLPLVIPGHDNEG